MFLAHIAERVLHRPLLIHPTKASVILSVLGERIGVESAFDEAELAMLLKPDASRLVGEPGGPVDGSGRRRTLYYQSKGIALIPIVGTLINRGAYIGASSGVLSYEGLAAQVEGAVSDHSVRGILLDIDSPGGEANGAFAFYEVLRDARKKKPITAFVNDMAASAAYGIAAQADEIVISQSSVTGSIGVVMVHLDQSEELKKKGRKPTLIFAGAHKVDANSFEPLPDAVRADLQREVDSFMDRFVAAVHAGRPAFSEAAIRGTEARVFIGATAIEAGLADRVGSFHETLSRLSIRSHNHGGSGFSMHDDPRVYSQAEHEAAIIAARGAERAELEAQHAAAVTAAAAAARIATLARVRGILNHAEAADRAGQAMVLALDTDMSVDAAAKMLAASPKIAALEPRIPPVAVRSAPQVGSDHLDRPDPSAGWEAAIAKVNATTVVKGRAA
jgi:signal peptide peptidase SppA